MEMRTIMDGDAPGPRCVAFGEDLDPVPVEILMVWASYPLYPMVVVVPVRAPRSPEICAFAQFARDPFSSIFRLVNGPEPGWRWIFAHGDIIAERAAID